MGHNTQNGAPQPVQPGDRSPETPNPYAGCSNKALVDLYNESVIASDTAEADPAICRELSIRLLQLAGLEEQRDTPLMGRSGPVIGKDGTQLQLSDYIEYAARHHDWALQSILDALLPDPGTPEYEAARTGALAWFNTAQG